MNQIIQDALRVARQTFDRGGKPAMQSEYSDPPTKTIDDWKWRPLREVKSQLGLTEIPSHVISFGRFMDETARKAGTTGLSARDLIKAFTITRSSIQRRATDADRLRASGLDLPDHVTGPVRPEGAFGHWLHTKMGQRYLNGAEKGRVDMEAVRDAVQVMAPFGRHETDIPDALIWAATNLPGREKMFSDMVAAAAQMESPASEWRAQAKQLRGIGPAKAGFVASMMGRGDQPTLDARQLILQTGQPTSEATPFLRRKGGMGAEEGVDRLAARQQAMDLATPSELQPYYQHLAHHAIWDKASNEETTHQDVMDAMRHAADGGRIEENPDLINHPAAQALSAAGAPGLPPPTMDMEAAKKGQLPVRYNSWDDVPTINPQHLVGKKIYPIFADLTRAGSAFEGIDSSKLDQPENLYGGPGYPLLPESQKHGLAWAVDGKARGTAKLLKDADYVAVSAMEPDSHQSNASFANAVTKNMLAYIRDNRISPENLKEINTMARKPFVITKKAGKNKEPKKIVINMDDFPGFDHPDVQDYLRNLTFEKRQRIVDIIGSAKAQEMGAPNIDKITRSTLDPQFSGVPSRHAMFLMRVPRNTEGEVDDEAMRKLLIDLKSEGLPEHPSYKYGLRGDIVGKFHAPVSPEILFKDWFEKANARAEKTMASGKRPNVRRAFDLEMPVTTVTQEVADMLPRHPRDIQSGKAAQLALNAFNDRWQTTNETVLDGGVGPAEFSAALRNSDASSTLSQYSPAQIKAMIKKGLFTGYKLKDGEVYFGLKRGTNYADEYKFEHPELTPNETALVSVINNEPGAKGVGGAPVVLKAIEHGATALDAYAVPSAKHPNGYLPSFYSRFGFKELGRIPFDPKYVSEQQLKDMKNEWTKAGWDEKLGMPAIVIMKWSGSDGDRAGAVRRFVAQSGQGSQPGSHPVNVRRAAGAVKRGTVGHDDPAQGQRGDDHPGGNRGGLRTGSRHPADRFSRTLAEVKSLSPEEMRHYGLDPAEVEHARSIGLKSGGIARQPSQMMRLHPAMNIPGVHIRTAETGEPIFRGDK